MKLIFAIIHDEDAPRLIAELTRVEYGVTKLSSSGGFLKSGNTTLMIGCEEEKIDDALSIIRKYSSSRKTAVNTAVTPIGVTGGYIPYPVEVTVGGATVFVVDVDKFEKM